MTDVFLHPPFDDPRLLARILGPGHATPSRPAELHGHALRKDAAGLRFALVADPEASPVEGVLVSPEPGMRARIDHLMTALGAAPVPVGTGAGDPAVAFAFPPGSAPKGGWVAEPLAPAHHAHVAEMIEEVMGHFGHRDAAELPALMHGIGMRALARSRGPMNPVTCAIGAGFGADAVETVARDFTYARYFGVEEHHLRHRRFDGATSDVLERAVFTSGDAVTVLPFDPHAGTVLLIEQFRAGLHARRDPQPWCLEPPAGRCDRPEPLEETARREAREEAGLELGRLERIAAYYPSPGTMSEYLTSFVGEADLGDAGGTYGLPEEHEDIRARVVPLEEALSAIDTGEIRAAPLILSLLWLDRNAARLRRLWR